ncbi:MAG: hypothetical protein IKC65_01910, partial [Lentisphaeria bacterium]|nr:hypothetical protein [Lentisphaeria bacterium]
MKSAEKNASRIDLSVNSACYVQQKSTTQCKEERGAFVRISTEVYGSVRSHTQPQTACSAQHQNLKEKGSATCQTGILPLYYLKKIYKKYTSLRPTGRTSRLPQANTSHLHIFTQSAFTLIELLGSATCQTGV